MIERILGKSQILFAAEGSTGGTVKKAVLRNKINWELKIENGDLNLFKFFDNRNQYPY